MDEIEEVQQHNMISNLPLLFANGYPTSLEKITESQLENFIPFMVQCSLGHINLQGKIDFSEPEWWPENVPYTIPFTKPKKFNGNWLEKMKEIVIICYQFHKSVFLLRFCNDLAAYEHASLRFINNYNSTTSLFDRRSNKLLVTFRNENMSYDQPQRSRKCLLQQKSKVNSQQQHMVEPAPFDIYLCDNCDAELYSEEAILEHEKTCNLDDDVIICDSPEPHIDNHLNLLPSYTTEDNELRKNFLLNFGLLYHNEPPPADTQNDKKRIRRLRGDNTLMRLHDLPVTSPAAQVVIKEAKLTITQEGLEKAFKNFEYYCYAPILAKGTTRPKYLRKKIRPPPSYCRFKKPPEYSTHVYTFPRRQFSQRHRNENFMFLNSLLIKRCRPISVRLRKITDNEIVKRKQANNSNKLNIKLTRDTSSRSSNWKISAPSAEIIVDTINLCSSDDDDDANQKFQSQLIDDVGDSCGSGSQSSFGQQAVIKYQLQKLAHRLNSEITLTPIPRAPTPIGPLRHSLSTTTNPTKIVAPATSTTNPNANAKGGHVTFQLTPKLEESKPLPLNHYEGNILLSPTQQNGTATPVTKPLQPSVFIFSNYTANPITLNSYLSTNTVSTSPAQHNNNNDLIVSSNYQNEENLHEAAARKNPEWYPASIAASNSAISTTHNGSSNGSSKAVAVSVNGVNVVNGVNGVNGRNARSLPLIPFTASKRVVSIDLTS